MATSTSVLIPSFRRPDSLEASLRALARQTVPPDEVLVVWQGDDATTGTRAEQLAAALPIVVRVLHLPEPGIVPAENLALDAAQGRIIFLIDDDALAPENWIERHLAFYDDPAVGAVGGPAITFWEGQRVPINGRTPVGRITWFGRFHGNMHDQPESWLSRPAFAAEHLVGYNMSLRRVAFDRFEDRLRRYWQLFEADACLQVRARGYRVLFDPGNVVEHWLTPRQSAYEPGRVGDLRVKLGNAAYNRAFVLSKHTRGPRRWARWLYASLVGTSEAPGPLLLPLAIRRHGQGRRELALARMIWSDTQAGWRDGRHARTEPARAGSSQSADRDRDPVAATHPPQV